MLQFGTLPRASCLHDFRFHCIVPAEQSGRLGGRNIEEDEGGSLFGVGGDFDAVGAIPEEPGWDLPGAQFVRLAEERRVGIGKWLRAIGGGGEVRAVEGGPPMGAPQRLRSLNAEAPVFLPASSGRGEIEREDGGLRGDDFAGNWVGFAPGGRQPSARNQCCGCVASTAGSRKSASAANGGSANGPRPAPPCSR